MAVTSTRKILGYLEDFNLSPMLTRFAELYFVPSGPVVSGIAEVLTTEPIKAYLVPPANDGTRDGGFTVDLAPNDTTKPASWYTIRIVWLPGSPNGYSAQDFPQWRVYVPSVAPSGGYYIGNLVDAAPNLALAAVSLEEPEGSFSPGSLWLQKDPLNIAPAPAGGSGLLYRRKA